jgi:hypothetical protein
VVEGARLESESGELTERYQNTSFRDPFNKLPLHDAR